MLIEPLYTKVNQTVVCTKNPWIKVRICEWKSSNAPSIYRCFQLKYSDSYRNRAPIHSNRSDIILVRWNSMTWKCRSTYKATVFCTCSVPFVYIFSTKTSKTSLCIRIESCTCVIYFYFISFDCNEFVKYVEN